MAREATQIETNTRWQLRELNRTKGQQSGGPSARAMLAQKGTRVLTYELKDELKRKAEVWVVAEKEKSEHLEKSDRRRFLMKRAELSYRSIYPKIPSRQLEALEVTKRLFRPAHSRSSYC